jgi:methyltransferase (TIGR00027 family)
MRSGFPSRTAQSAAVRRAVHQLVDIPHVFDDPLALRILDPEDAAPFLIECMAAYLPAFRCARAFIAARSRYAEDQLARATASGTSQYVILGAGLDTFAYRNPYPDRNLRIFEVDHPDTQAWKLRRLARAAISVPSSVRFVPIDFERQKLDVELEKAGLRLGEPAFFSCLGVTPYLTKAAGMAMFTAIHALCSDNAVAFDYAAPRRNLSDWEKIAFDVLSDDVDRTGEPFRGFFGPEALVKDLTAIGFHEVDSPTTEQLNALYFRGRLDGLTLVGHLGGVMCAS